MPGRILFVEDNLNTSRAMKVMLELRGYSVDTALTLRDALSRLHDTDYDVVISDLGLPDGSGHEIIAHAPRPIRAIALSGRTGEDARRESLASGFSEYISKPFDLPVLLAAIERLLHSD